MKLTPRSLMRPMYPFATFLLLLLVVLACRAPRELPQPPAANTWETQRLTGRLQEPGGNAEAGFRFIVEGNYVGGGIPLETVPKAMFRFAHDGLLSRTGTAAALPYLANAFEGPNGTPVTAPNCFTCHANPSFLDSAYWGLGNTQLPFNRLKPFGAKVMNAYMALRYAKEDTAYQDFVNYGTLLAKASPNLVTNNPVLNPAFRLAEVCYFQREPQSLEYQEQPYAPTIAYTLACDVPPLWHVKKKQALYYTGSGRGAFSKLMMQATVLGITDSTFARSLQPHFVDVVAWCESLEAPKYPFAVQEPLLSQGQAIFEENCSRCHGTYAPNPEDEAYPNKIVALEEVGTDPYFAWLGTQSKLEEWYNKSWFATSDPPSSLQSQHGYVAPPLDGIWATAPYLHNGSVPTLSALLNSPERPTHWHSQGFAYDTLQVGWHYFTPSHGRRKSTYDTTLPGSGNQGHTYGDDLSASERKALIEYLKTL